MTTPDKQPRRVSAAPDDLTVMARCACLTVMAPSVYSKGKVTAGAVNMLHGAHVAKHRRQLSRAEEVARLAGAILFALFIAFGWWLILREVVGGDYAGVLTVLVGSVLTSALISQRRRRRSSTVRR